MKNNVLQYEPRKEVIAYETNLNIYLGDRYLTSVRVVAIIVITHNIYLGPSFGEDLFYCWYIAIYIGY